MTKVAKPYLLKAERALDQLETYIPPSEEIFLEQRVLQDAILLQIFQIGENLAQLRSRWPQGFARAPESWRQIIGFRNTIAHGYERVKIPLVWKYLTEDLPELRATLLAALSEGWFEVSESDGQEG